ncbi:Uma2 family endonuclease [Synechocystis salina LEGE 06155]|nr:Uma2 family endonuclease [Synechocystis salina LEGE 06155]
MVAQLQQTKATYTPEEYLSLEETAEFRNEYVDGEIIPMTGGTTIHNQIALNFCRHFPLTIDDQDYYTYINDVKVWIELCRAYTYPDILIIEGKPIYQGDNPVVVTNPKVIIEVLSDSTANYDRTKKFGFYRLLPSLQEYILISQSAYYVEQFSKWEDGQWLFNPVEGREGLLNLTSINFQISMQDLYQRIEL